MVIILGLGYTGKRLARRLLGRGVPVCAVVRDRGRFAELEQAGLRLAEWRPDGGAPAGLSANGVIFHSIPPLPATEMAALDDAVKSLWPARIVYISSTAVYGDQIEVDEHTPAQPNDERGRKRLGAEISVSEGPWSSLILRAAAIYGPDRGVHVAVREGRTARGAGSGVVSRIHAEDLAALSEAGMFSDLQGAYPVGDDLPCPSAEIEEWYRTQLNMEPRVKTAAELTAAGRRVDGRKIRELLRVELMYPSWKTGLDRED